MRPTTAARKALATLGREWEGLARHRRFPELPLDNNAAERALRAAVVGRKNYYGSGSVWAAAAAGRIWTVTATAARAGCNPLSYLIAYLEACAREGGRAPAGEALARPRERRSRARGRGARALLPLGAGPCRPRRLARGAAGGGAGSDALMAPLRYCGRELSEADLAVLRSLAATLPTRTAIAAAACEALGWYRHDGRRKEMSARVAPLRMAADGLLTLPAPRNTNGNGRLSRRMEPVGEPAAALAASLQELGDVELVLVEGVAASRRWRTLIARRHYLGYAPFAGAQLRYLVESPRGTVAALGFAASAWKCAARGRAHRLRRSRARGAPPPRGRRRALPHPAARARQAPRLADPFAGRPPRARRLARGLRL